MHRFHTARGAESEDEQSSRRDNSHAEHVSMHGSSSDSSTANAHIKAEVTAAEARLEQVAQVCVARCLLPAA